MVVWDVLVGSLVEVLVVLATVTAALGTHQWAAAIVLLTLGIRTLLIPLTVMQMRSARTMRRLQPEIERVRRTFKAKPERVQRELQALFRREGYNPMAGCLPQVASLPFVAGVYWAIRRITAPVADGGLGVVAIPLFGLGNLAAPAIASVAGILLVIVLGLAGYLSARRTAPTTGGQRWMRLVPVGSAAVAAFLPGAVVLYWATGAVYQLGQQMLMRT